MCRVQDAKLLEETRMKIIGLSPYWFDEAEGSAVHNTVDMQSLFLLTGPNGGGKSSFLRSICAVSLLGICGFMVPAKSALIPPFDSIMLHMKSYDSPADGKSSFQVGYCCFLLYAKVQPCIYSHGTKGHHSLQKYNFIVVRLGLELDLV